MWTDEESGRDMRIFLLIFIPATIACYMSLGCLPGGPVPEPARTILSLLVGLVLYVFRRLALQGIGLLLRGWSLVDDVESGLNLLVKLIRWLR